MCRGLNNHQRYECTESLLNIKVPFKKDNDLGMFNCSSVHPTKWIANRREHPGKLYRCSVGWLFTSDCGALIYWFRWWTTQYRLTSLIVAEYVIDVFTEKATIMPDSLLQTEFHVCLQTTNAIRPKNPLNMQVYWENDDNQPIAPIFQRKLCQLSARLVVTSTSCCLGLLSSSWSDPECLGLANWHTLSCWGQFRSHVDQALAFQGESA